MGDNKQLVPQVGKSVIIDKSNQESFKVSVEEFLSELSPQEREIIRKQLTHGTIGENDMDVIKNSKHDINGFLIKCEDLTDIEKALVLNAIGDVISETKRKVMDILNMTSETVRIEQKS